MLAGDEEAFAFRVVGDAVEDVGSRAIFGWQNSGEINDADDLAVGGIDADDKLGGPDVGEDFAVDKFQFVQLWNQSVGVDVDGALHLKRIGIEKKDLRGAVAHDQLRIVSGEAPTFGGIGEFLLLLERGEVINETLVILPGELKKFAVLEREALGEVFSGNGNLFPDFAGFEIDFAEGGFAVKAGAFVKHAVEVKEALGEGPAVVRIGVDDFVGVLGDRRAGAEGWRGGDVRGVGASGEEKWQEEKP